jgi:hypothetical protein
MRLRSLTLLVLVSTLSTAAAAETVRIEADRDATLIEDPDGALGNGSGPSFFVGRTSQDESSTRRALLRFDVAAAVPRPAIIESVSLTLFMNPSHPEMREIRLHRVMADWGEGASSSSGGIGRPAEPGDATWIHTYYDTEYWLHGGGQFIGRPTASLVIAGSGFYTWESTNALVRDVRLWRSNPRRNFGWILIGDETEPSTSKKFASRENPDLALRPVLEVTYRWPGARGHAPR